MNEPRPHLKTLEEIERTCVPGLVDATGRRTPRGWPRPCVGPTKMGGLEVATRGDAQENHHAAPRCLVSLHEKANGSSLDGEGIQA